MAYFGVTMEGLLEDAITIGKQYLQAAQIVAKLSLTPDDALVEKVTKEMLDSYLNNGYTEDQAKALIEGEGKTELRAELLFSLASDYIIKNNNFVQE